MSSKLTKAPEKKNHNNVILEVGSVPRFTPQIFELEEATIPQNSYESPRKHVECSTVVIEVLT
jgi:hypothetical protein